MDVHYPIGSWSGLPSTTMETYTGRPVDSARVRPEDVCWEDVAHALANTCRYGGHCRAFYSVAQHCIHCHDQALLDGYSLGVAVACLLHDGAEAYWHDLGRPLKNAAGMEVYDRYHDATQNAVNRAARVLDFSSSHAREIHRIDNAVLKYEAQRLMVSRGDCWNGFDKLEAAKISSWSFVWYRLPGRAEAGFLKRLRRWLRLVG